MQNRYPGKCLHCNETVRAREGECQKIDGKWRVWHHDCEAWAREDDAERHALAAGHYGHRGTPGHFFGGRCEDAPCCGCCD